jgi:hypothetical protein
MGCTRVSATLESLTEASVAAQSETAAAGILIRSRSAAAFHNWPQHLVEPALDHHLGLARIFFFGQAINVIEQHFRIARQLTAIDLA